MCFYLRLTSVTGLEIFQTTTYQRDILLLEKRRRGVINSLLRTVDLVSGDSQPLVLSVTIPDGITVFIGIGAMPSLGERMDTRTVVADGTPRCALALNASVLPNAELTMTKIFSLSSARPLGLRFSGTFHR